MMRWVALLATTACGASNAEAPYSTTTTTGAVVGTPGSVAPAEAMREAPPRIVLGDEAAAQIASIRCTHEDACGNVGPGGAFPTFDACVTEVRLVHRRQLTGAVCANGVDPYALQLCIEESRDQACGESTTSCDNARLCR